MRGYFAIGVDRISKPGNVGAIVRTAHAFGASFFFAIDPALDLRDTTATDTSAAVEHLPVYRYAAPEALQLPQDCALVGVELTDDAVELPSFRHPPRAAYVFGPERGSLSASLLARCDHVVKIPTAFCVNVSLAAALTIYDRMISMGRFAERPVRPGAPVGEGPTHRRGGIRIRTKARE